MALSERARRWLAAEQARKAAARAAREAELEQARTEFRQQFLDRVQTATQLGWSVHRLKRAQTAGRGPRPTKMGEHKQSRTFWEAAEVQRYLLDPAAYEQARQAAPDAGTGGQD